MLWVTMTMAKSCFVDQILDLGGGDWVERRARLVEQDHLGPQRGARQRPLHALVDFRARELLV
jgi:hypothetical protein